MVLGALSFNKKGDITAIGWAVYRWDKNGNYDEITEGFRDIRGVIPGRAKGARPEPIATILQDGAPRA